MLIRNHNSLVGETPKVRTTKGSVALLSTFDLDHLPSFSFMVHKGALLGNRFVIIHVEVDFFGSWIAVVTEDYLPSGSHSSFAA